MVSYTFVSRYKLNRLVFFAFQLSEMVQHSVQKKALSARATKLGLASLSGQWRWETEIERLNGFQSGEHCLPDSLKCTDVCVY